MLFEAGFVLAATCFALRRLKSGDVVTSPVSEWMSGPVGASARVTDAGKLCRLPLLVFLSAHHDGLKLISMFNEESLLIGGWFR